MSNNPTPNVNVPAIPQQPSPDPNALAFIMRLVIAGIQNLAGQAGGPLDRACTWADLVRLGVASQTALQSPAGTSELTSLAEATTSTTTGLAAETAARAAGDVANATAIAAEKTRAEAAEAELASGLTGTASSAGLAAEATTRANADTTLQGSITAEATTRANADTTLQGSITAEATTRANADTTLQANINALPHKYATLVGDGSSVSFVVSHHLGTQLVIVQAYQAAAPFGQETCGVAATDVNNVTVTFAAAPALDGARVVVIG